MRHCRCLMLGWHCRCCSETHVCPQFVSCGCRNLTKADIEQLLHDAASGLCHLHSLNVVHCDLKANNVSVLPGRACTCSRPCRQWLHCTAACHSAAHGLWTSGATAGPPPLRRQVVSRWCRLRRLCSGALQPQLLHGSFCLHTLTPTS